MEDFASIVGTIFAALFRAAFQLAVQGWALMVAVVIVHGLWLPHLQTIGFWWAASLCALGSLIASPFSRGSARTDS